MPEPISMSAMLKIAGVSAGANVLEDLYNRLSNRDIFKLQEDLLNERVQYNEDMARRSRGKFTEGELQQIRMNAEPQLNAIAGNISARLGTGSAAGASIIAQAAQAPVTAAMNQASGSYAQSLTALSQAVNKQVGALRGDKSFTEDIGAIIKAYTFLKGQGYNGNQDETLKSATRRIIPSLMAGDPHMGGGM